MWYEIIDFLYFFDSVSILHSLMVAHLEDLNLQDVSKRLKKQIYVIMKSEKERRVWENKDIERAVLGFFEDCSILKPGSAKFIERFHKFMTRMLDAHCLGTYPYMRFYATIEDVDVEQLKEYPSIQNLSAFVQGIKYMNPGVGGEEEEDEDEDEDEEP